ncbi:MAG: prepilin-type N-terminal cleavage/methylation domain-containing protein [Candidatus Omnitrophica bacterium]|nr:prepilin-type N-terminal cleavage/methylation domain-containing protein [Candidatus Omnitrophota bacterium]
MGHVLGAQFQFPSASPQPRASRFGLTLVELLVAMTILVTVSTSAALLVRGITRAWRTGQLRTERYQQARLLFDVFERELSSSVANSRYPLVGLKASEGPPFHEGGVSDALYFVGTLPGRNGFVERGYWLTAQGVLMCHDQEPADGEYATGTSEPCGTDVSQFTASYFDGVEWLDRWDARPGAPQAGRLPKAIHLTVKIGKEKPESFDTVIYVPTS